MTHLIELKDVYKIYPMGDETVHALDGVSLSIDQGEFVAIVGSSGSGKSTAMNIIGCLDVPTSGSYHLGGVDVSTMDDDQQAEIRNRMLGFVFQSFHLINSLNVLDNVELPLLYRKSTEKSRRETARAVLEKVGLSHRTKHFPSQLSGGQRQRVGIARALAMDPGIILMDEPFSALDYQTRLAVSADIWRILQQEGKTALLVTHDIAEAVSMSDRVVVLSRRPAVVKAEMDMGALRRLPPLERRDTPEFHRYFNAIWKELDVHA